MIVKCKECIYWDKNMEQCHRRAPCGETVVWPHTRHGWCGEGEKADAIPDKCSNFECVGGKVYLYVIDEQGNRKKLLWEP